MGAALFLALMMAASAADIVLYSKGTLPAGTVTTPTIGLDDWFQANLVATMPADPTVVLTISFDTTADSGKTFTRQFTCRFVGLKPELGSDVSCGYYPSQPLGKGLRGRLVINTNKSSSLVSIKIDNIARIKK